MLDALDASAVLVRLGVLAALALLTLGVVRLIAAVVERRRRAAAGRAIASDLRRLLPPGQAALLYFSGPRCAPCARQRSIIERLRRSAGLAVVEVDVVERPDLAQRFGILTVPSTAVVAGDGRVLALNFGFTPAERLSAQVRSAGLGRS
jgi:thiol-disulfide isomerase/thioredoxin